MNRILNCASCQELSAQIIDLNTAKDDLFFERNAIEKKFKTYSEELAKLKDIHGKLVKELEDSDGNLGLKLVENQELTAKVLELSGKITSQNTENRVLKMNIETLDEDKEKLKKNIDNLSQQISQYQTLEARIAPLEAENAGLKAKVQGLEALVRDLEAAKDLKEKERDDFKNLLAEEQIKNEQRKSSCRASISTVYSDNSENAELEEIIKGLVKKYQEAKEEIKILREQTKQGDDDVKIVIQENEELKKDMKKYKENIGELDKMKKVYQFKEIKSGPDEFKTFYDCRILADSFFPLLQNEAWPIEFNDYKKYADTKEKPSVRVSVLGYEKTGKSFMISQIMGKDVPQGKLMKTTGICVIYPSHENIPWTALDTPGTNISLRTDFLMKNLQDYFKSKRLSEQEMLRMLYGDNILMESLLHEFVANNSQVLLIVVGKLRRDDQRFINRIKEQKDYQNKRIIVVHNLLDCRELEDIEDIIKEDIVDTFGASRRPVSFDQLQKNHHGFVYLEKDKRDTEHVIMAHEGSPAGDHYNLTATTYVKQVISSCPFSEKFDLVEAFYHHLNVSVKNYLSSSMTIPATPFVLSEKEGIPSSLSLNNPNLYHLKKNFTDEFGQIRTYAREGLETVPFAVKIVTKTDSLKEERFLEVDFEVSGEFKDEDLKYKAQTFGNQVVVMIKGKSGDNTVRSEVETVCETTRKFGEFLITTESIDLEGYTIFKGERPLITSPVPGLKTMSIKLYPQETDDDF